VQAARAAYFPTLDLSANATRSRNGSVNASGAGTGNGGPRNNFNLGLDAGWELDVWGRVRRQVESNSAGAQASAADLAAVTLSAQAELATDYFQLRITDDQKRLLDATVQAYEKSLQITQNQYKVGVVGKGDVAQAQAQLDSTKSQAAGVGLQRAQLEHGIAVLIGKAPAEVTIAPTTTSLTIPAIPVAVPSALLERRPDIAAAERRAAAANAEIGVAKAAYYPDITLGLSGGFENSVLSKLLTWPARFWSVGPSLAANLFNGGATLAQTRQAEAAYDASVAQYRQTVLTGFQEVEDNLAGVRILGEQAGTQAQAVESANELLRIAQNQYKAGTVSYLNVATAQSSAYNARNTALNIESQRLTSAVGLIKALGGGWEAPTK
jgi:NodT family efflux transporter outer membrane factor (OMF) lipoprotein